MTPENRRPHPQPATSKWLLSIGFIAASIGYAFFQNTRAVAGPTEIPTAVLPGTSTKESTSTSVTPATATTTVSVPPPKPIVTVPTPVPTKMYRDGSYTGNAVDAFYGIVQVQAIIQNGALADIQFLQYPNDRGTTQRISSDALPILRQEAIQIQKAQVDTVSGATQTSEGFVASLSSALEQAKS